MNNKGGCIKKLKNDKYKWTGYYVDELGKVHRPSRTFYSLSDAKDYQKFFEKNGYTTSSNKCFSGMTICEYYNYWKNKYWPKTDKDVIHGKYAFSTVAKWKPTFDNYIIPTIGNQKIDNINFSKYEILLRKSNIVDKTLYNINSTLISMLKKAYNTDQIISSEIYARYKIELDNIRQRVDKIKTKDYSTYNILSQTDYKIILDYMKSHNYYYTNLIEFCRETGIRISECVIKNDDITIHRIGFGNEMCNNYGAAEINKNVTRVLLNTPNEKGSKSELRVLNYTKNNTSNRTIPLNHYAIECIDRQIELKKKFKIKSPYIFTTKTGGLIDERNVLRSLHCTIQKINAEQNLNIPIRGLHSLRKLFGNTGIKKVKIPREDISKALGHASLQTTESYYISFDKDDALSMAKSFNQFDPRILASKIDRVIELFNQGKLLEKLSNEKKLKDELQIELLLIDSEITELFVELKIWDDYSYDGDIYTLENWNKIKKIEYDIKKKM